MMDIFSRLTKPQPMTKPRTRAPAASRPLLAGHHRQSGCSCSLWPPARSSVPASLGSVGVRPGGARARGGCLLRRRAAARRWHTPWVPVVEGVLAAVACSGLAHRHRWNRSWSTSPCPASWRGCGTAAVTTANTSLASAAADDGQLGVRPSARRHRQPRSRLALPWLVVGLGAGLLAAWQTRSVRHLEAAQAPYAAAHRLVGQLHALTQQTPMELDVASVARAAGGPGPPPARSRTVGRAGAAPPRTACSSSPAHGPVGIADEQIAGRCVRHGRAVQQAEATALPLRVGDHVFGALVLRRERRCTPTQLSDLQQLVDEQALRLDTALLFDDVRCLATTEERNRLARDIHDGVAQQIVPAGLPGRRDRRRVRTTRRSPRRGRRPARRDQPGRRASSGSRSSTCATTSTRQAASPARCREYVRELGTPQRPARPSARSTSAGRGCRGVPRQSCCGSPRRPSATCASTRGRSTCGSRLTTDGTELRLVVEDDGVGAAGAAGRPLRAAHHARARRAHQRRPHLAARPDGGTVVTLRSRLDRPHHRRR